MLTPVKTSFNNRKLCMMDLPSELMIIIFRNLSCRSLLRCCSVCHQFKDVIDHCVELQYHIELCLDGMTDGPPGPISPAERLQRLRDLRHAWSALEWRKSLLIPMPGACMAYELVGGVFAKVNAISGGRGSQQFRAVWLPSADQLEQSLIRDDLAIPTRDFAIDPSQDLIALVEAEDRNGDILAAFGHFFPTANLCIHLRTISTNAPHPQAQSPVIRLSLFLPINNAFIQFVNDVLGILFFTEPLRPRIILWNWKTGKTLVDQDSDQLPEGTSDFTFLSDRAYMLTCARNDGSMEIFTFGDESPDDTNEILNAVVHVASLKLPPLQDRVHVNQLQTHTGPFLAKCPADKLFTTDNEERIHVVSVDYGGGAFDGLRRRSSFCMYMQNSITTAYIHQHRDSRGGPPLQIPWEKWGPTNTRFLYQPSLFQWLRYVHGKRVVIPTYNDHGHTMEVLDFNVKATARQLVQRLKASTWIQTVTEGSRIAAETVFASTVTTFLPYRALNTEEFSGFSGMMIDDERLVGLKYPAFSDGDMKDIHVFVF
ncbi:hypothetical protein BJ138DRAFT_1159727 [Hygrophoropsis aurantiaca]|uniref:Uncharacterized protein n=1 Tax=Hygrophoropsis aurantiaca TaxID=72124 RepID=A0ACB8A3R6_9AGAM|nr:hypothetical protein BJ138DRAFT_1159727 [Hygrophoropsis aurantiaca]